MPAVANIVLADAQGTPVNHTFLPLGPDASGVWWFEDQSSATPIGYWRVSIKLNRPQPGGNGSASSSNRVNEAIIGLHQPTMETLGTNDNGILPPPTVSYVSRSVQRLTMPERSSLQNRKDLRKMSMNLLADANVIDLIENLRPYY